MLTVAAAMAFEATGVDVVALFAMTVALGGFVLVDCAELIAVALETIGVAEAGTAWVAAGAAAPVGAAIEVAVTTGAITAAAATGWSADAGVPAAVGTGAPEEVTGTVGRGVEAAGWDVGTMGAGAPAVASDMVTSFAGKAAGKADQSMGGRAGVGATCDGAVAVGALLARKSPKR